MSPLVTRMNMRCALASLLCLALLQCGEDPPAKPVTPQSASCEALGLQNGQPFVSAGGDDTNMDIFNIVYETNGMRIWYEYRSASVNTGNVVTGKVYNLAFDSKMSVTSYDATLNGTYCHYGPPGPTNPEPVFLYQPTEVSSDWARLEWSKNNDADFARYEVYRGDYENFPPSEGEKVATVTVQDTCEAVLKGLSRETNYRYKVLVVDKEGLTTPSNEVTLTTGYYRTYGTTSDEMAFAIAKAPDGGYVLAGRCEKLVEQGYRTSVYIVKLDRDGFKEWALDYGNPGIDDYAKDIVATDDGGYLVVCEEGDYPNNIAHLLRLDAKGNVVWDKLHEPKTQFYEIKAVSSGAFLITGFKGDGISNQSLVLKISSMGDVIWRLDLSQKDNMNEALTTVDANDGSYYVICSSGNYIDKITSDGKVVWIKTIEGSPCVVAKALMTAQKEIIAIGYSFGCSAAWCFDTTGTVKWTLGLPSGSSERKENAILPIDQQTYFLTYHTLNDGVRFFGIDSDGQLLWERKLEKQLKGSIYDGLIDDDGNIVLAGVVSAPNHSSDMLFMKVDRNGRFLSKRIARK